MPAVEIESPKHSSSSLHTTSSSSRSSSKNLLPPLPTTAAHETRLRQRRPPSTNTATTTSVVATGAGVSFSMNGGANADDSEDAHPFSSAVPTPPPSQSDAPKGGSDEDRGVDPIPPRSIDDFLLQASDSWKSRSDDDSATWHVPPFKYAMMFVALGVANSSDATEILCLSYILGQQDFQSNILNHSPFYAGVLASAVFAGMLVGGLVVGATGDNFGRRKLLLVGLALNATTGLLSSMAGNVWILSVLRFAAGIGVGATVPPLFTLCSELSSPRDRGFWVTVAASFWMMGSIYVAVWGWIIFAYWQWGWRVLAAISAFPALCAFFLVLRFVPESPRFLALQGQYEAALHSTRQLAVSMKYRGDMLTKSELLHYYPLSDVTSVPTSSVLQACQKFLDSARLLYVIPEIRPTTVNLQVIWFALSFGSYGLTTWINLLFEQVHLQNVYTNALLFALANLPGNVISAVLMDRGASGRSRLLTGSLLAAAAALVTFAAAATRPAPSRLWIVGSACAFQACTIAAWNAVDVLSSELFPTQVRATGMGLCAASGRFGAMLAQTVNGYLVGSPVRLLLVAATTLLVGAASPALLPDATGRPVVDRVDGVRRTSSDVVEGVSLHVPTGASMRHSYQRVNTGGDVV